MDDIRAKRRKRLIIGLSILGAIIVLIVALIVACSNTSDKTDDKDGEYKKVEKRTIANSVSANGKISAINSEEVTSQRFGAKVTAVYVKESDTVVPGQVICQFDTTTLREQINNLRENIAQAKVNRANRQEEYDNRVAEANANRLQNIAQTEARLNDARTEYSVALIELAVANQNYDDYMAVPYHRAYDTEATQLQTVIEAKKSNVDLKKAAIETYEQTLNALQSQTGESFDDARASMSEASDSTISSMEEQVRELEKSIAESTVRATIGGTVTELNVKSGDNYTVGPVCVIEGVNDLMIEAEVGEVDIPDVAVGMKVMVKTEATKDAELTGFVTYVAPKAKNSGSSANGLGALSGMIGMDMSSLTSGVGSSSNSSASYPIRISLVDQNPRLRLGMNAKVSIITEAVDDAISVPIDAVRKDGDRQYIEIATNYDEASKSDGNTPYDKKKVDVTTGIKGSYYIQVFGDVKVGDYVYVPAAEGEDSLEEIMNMMGSSAGV